MRAVKRGSEKQNPVLGASLANSKISSNHLLLVPVSHVQNRKSNSYFMLRLESYHGFKAVNTLPEIRKIRSSSSIIKLLPV